ncbi:hypothetical protein [Actinomadura sediminis]|uniref:Uncharacterized protein n=1 Tax=Actinomadura sediminis TaxID=1038904 RepID=A0ABW3EL83_9ACTN
MSDGLLLVFLRHLLPEWTITRDVHGVWRATGRTHVAASSVEGLVETIRAADPGGCARAVRWLTEPSGR